MKKINLNYFILLLFTISLVACKGKNGSAGKEVKPLKTEVQGYLGDYLQVVDGTYQATKDQSLIPSWVIKVKIKAIKAYTANDPSLKDGNDGPLKLDLYDDKGMPITELDNLESSFEDDSKLLDILSKGQGETWVTFSKFNSSSGLQQLPDNTTSFTINSVSKDTKPTSASAGSQSSTVHHFTGAVGKYPVEVTINNESADITGSYRYKSKSASLNLKGSQTGDKLTLSEYDEKGNKCGSFVGKWADGIYEGQWTNATESRLMDFKFVEEMQTTANDNNSSESTTDKNTDNNTLTASGSEDWDKLLDNYEEYADEYIKFYKKAQSGDQDAMTEYPAMMEKTLQFEGSLSKARKNNSLTPDQATRMLKIQTKMFSAVSNK